MKFVFIHYFIPEFYRIITFTQLISINRESLALKIPEKAHSVDMILMYQSPQAGLKDAIGKYQSPKRAKSHKHKVKSGRKGCKIPKIPC